MLRRLAVLVLMLAAVMVPAGQAAAAHCERPDPTTGRCPIEAVDPGNPGNPPGGGGGSSTFSGCTYEYMSPQLPPPDGAVASPDSQWFWQVCYVASAEVSRTPVWGPDRALNSALQPLVDPRVLAQEAISMLVMYAPAIATAPPQGSQGTVVGIPIWMWNEQSPSTTGPISATATAGTVSVTATGRVQQIVWDMGDGSTRTCGIGTPYPAGGTDRPSPDCGYTYELASSNYVEGPCVPNPDAPSSQLCGGPWPLTATSTWEITWAGGGMTGAETLELTSTGEIMIRELYVLNSDD